MPASNSEARKRLEAAHADIAAGREKTIEEARAAIDACVRTADKPSPRSGGFTADILQREKELRRA